MARLAGASLCAVVGGRKAVEQLTDPNVQVIDHLRTVASATEYTDNTVRQTETITVYCEQFTATYVGGNGLRPVAECLWNKLLLFMVVMTCGNRKLSPLR